MPNFYLGSFSSNIVHYIYVIYIYLDLGSDLYLLYSLLCGSQSWFAICTHWLHCASFAWMWTGRQPFSRIHQRWLWSLGRARQADRLMISWFEPNLWETNINAKKYCELLPFCIWRKPRDSHSMLRFGVWIPMFGATNNVRYWRWHIDHNSCCLFVNTFVFWGHDGFQVGSDGYCSPAAGSRLDSTEMTSLHCWNCRRTGEISKMDFVFLWRGMLIKGQFSRHLAAGYWTVMLPQDCVMTLWPVVTTVMSFQIWGLGRLSLLPFCVWRQPQKSTHGRFPGRFLQRVCVFFGLSSSNSCVEGRLVLERAIPWLVMVPTRTSWIALAW